MARDPFSFNFGANAKPKKAKAAKSGGKSGNTTFTSKTGKVYTFNKAGAIVKPGGGGGKSGGKGGGS